MRKITVSAIQILEQFYSSKIWAFDQDLICPIIFKVKEQWSQEGNFLDMNLKYFEVNPSITSFVPTPNDYFRASFQACLS